MTMSSTPSDSNTRQTVAATRAANVHYGDRSFFTGQDIGGAVLTVIMIWGPLAAGAFLGS